MSTSATSWLAKLKQLGQTRIELRLPAPRWPANVSQRTSLLQVLRLAIANQLDPVPLLESLAQDESGSQQRRIRRLVNHLGAGRSLPQSVELVPGLLAEDDLLALQLGMQLGNLPETIRQRIAIYGDERGARLKLRLWREAWYLGAVSCICFCIGMFLLRKISPTLQQVMVDMGADPPPQFEAFQGLANQVVQWWWLPTVAVILLAALGWTGRLRRWFRRAPLTRRCSLQSIRSAELLEQLHVAASSGRPLASCISTLARYHYNPTVRGDLLWVRNELDHGADLWESLQRTTFLKPVDVDAIRMAQRAGNDTWAMARLAVTKRIQCSRRNALLLELVQPVCIIMLGGLVLLLALSLFTPLLRMLPMADR